MRLYLQANGKFLCEECLFGDNGKFVYCDLCQQQLFSMEDIRDALIRYFLNEEIRKVSKDDQSTPP